MTEGREAQLAPAEIIRKEGILDDILLVDIKIGLLVLKNDGEHVCLAQSGMD